MTAELPDVEVLLSERVTSAQVDGIRRGELDIGLARPPFDTALLSSRVILREPLMAVVPDGASAGRISTGRSRPQDFEGQAVIGYHHQQSRYFHELSVRFLANAHPRIEQRVHQVLTAMLLVAAERGLALAPASATSLHVEGVVFKELAHGGGDTRLDADPSGPSSCTPSGRATRSRPVAAGRRAADRDRRASVEWTSHVQARVNALLSITWISNSGLDRHRDVLPSVMTTATSTQKDAS